MNKPDLQLSTPLATKPTDKLVVENLHLQYGDNPILKGVSMTLNPGEVVALLGASGSGKTTLLRSVAGLEEPSQGKIAIGDSVLFDSAAGVDTVGRYGVTATSSAATQCVDVQVPTAVIDRATAQRTSCVKGCSRPQRAGSRNSSAKIPF